MNPQKHILIGGAILVGLGLGLVLTPKLFGTKKENKLALYLEKYDKYPGMTPPASDRAFWDSIPERPAKIAPDPNLHAHDRIRVGTAQEAAYGTGEWIPLIESGLEEAIAVPWQTVSDGRKPMVGWKVTQLAGGIAHTLATLEGQLNEDIVKRTKVAIKERVINPFLADVQKKQTETLHWYKDSCPWLEIDTNWTAVCISYILYAGLIVEEDINERAKLLEICIEQSNLYLETFEDDGYLAAGIRYWNWGFRHYVLIAERVLHATGGKINLYAKEKVRKIVEFQLSWNLENKEEKKVMEEDVFGEKVKTQEEQRKFLEEEVGFYPIFGDNSNPSTSMPQVRYILSQRYNTPYVGAPLFRENNEMNGPFYSAALSASLIKTPKKTIKEVRGDYLIKDGKAAIVRDTDKKIALAIKGGGNNEEHNHNDLGGYTLFQSEGVDTPWDYVTGDAGFGTYSKGDFTEGLRYTFPLLGSYGHPVPVVNNTLQSDGFEYTVEMIRSESNKRGFSIEYDLKGAYNLPGLIKLTREITYEKNNDALVVKDSFAATSPITFETPIITESKPIKGEDYWTFDVDGREFVMELISSAPAKTSRSEIKNNYKNLHRTGILIYEPVTEGQIVYRIRPKTNDQKIKTILKEDITNTYVFKYNAGGNTHGEYKLYKKGKEDQPIIEAVSTTLVGRKETKHSLPPQRIINDREVVLGIAEDLSTDYPHQGVENIVRILMYKITGYLSVRGTYLTNSKEKIKIKLKTHLEVKDVNLNEFDGIIDLIDPINKSKYKLSVYLTDKSNDLKIDITKKSKGESLIDISFSLDQRGTIIYNLENEQK